MTTFYYSNSAHSNLLCSSVPDRTASIEIAGTFNSYWTTRFYWGLHEIKTTYNFIFIAPHCLIHWLNSVISSLLFSIQIESQLNISRNHNYDIEMSSFLTGFASLASLGSNIEARRTEAETFPVLHLANHVLEYFDVAFEFE